MNDPVGQPEASEMTPDKRVLEALSKERQDFLAVLNHRLRTPILATERAASLLLQGDFGSMQPEQIQVLELIRENANELDRLLDMLIDIYKYKNHSKPLSITSTNLHDFIDDIAHKMTIRADARHIELRVNNGCDTVNVDCDRNELEKAVSHLVENAIKHARSHVVLRGHAREEGGCTIEVEDDGKGIAEQDLANLFDRFFLISTNGKYAEFTGTGLCLCSEICKAHGGKISCQSTVEQGTNFRIVLPDAPLQQKDSRPSGNRD